MKTDALKKHHFWILAGGGLLFSLLAFLMVMVNVSAAVSKEKAEIDAKLAEVAGARPKGTKGIEDMGKQKEVLEARKKDLWKANYEQQKSLFAWPTDRGGKLKALEQQYTKFGDPIKGQEDARETFTRAEVYTGAYEQLADAIKPTTFPQRNWRTVLRHVTDWGTQVPTANRIWLALEDLWVQKTLLLAVNDINAAVRVFTPVDDDKSAPPLKRKFRNRIWDLELEVPTEGPLARKVFLVKLTNRTDRMQVLGLNKTMSLRVWLNDTEFPVLLRFQKEFVRAKATFEIRQKVDVVPPPDRKALMDQGLLEEVQVIPSTLAQGIPGGVEVQKIRKVEQVLDDLNVPVRQVLDVVLGYKDARHAPAGLTPPKFWPAAEAVADPAAPAGLGTGMGSPDGAAGEPGGIGVPGMGGRMGMMGGGSGRGSKTGGPAVVLDANRNRYLQVTDQVRRMPVAVILLVDQMFMQDALVAYANSPLRFQVTQFHWKRFRGNLGSTSAAGGYDADGGEAGETGGNASGGGEGGPPPGRAGGPGAMMPGGGSPDGEPDLRGGGGGLMMPGGLMGGGLMGGYGSGMMSGFGSASNAAADAQATSGLVELTIYGIVTLYEKYPDPPAADGATAAPTDAAAPPNATPPVGNGTPDPAGGPAPAPAPPPVGGNSPAPAPGPTPPGKDKQ
jgi:hypothetical protein